MFNVDVDKECIFGRNDQVEQDFECGEVGGGSIY